MKNSIFLLLYILFFSSLSSQNNTNWSKPENIDPMNEHTGDFLDARLENYILSASIAEVERRYKDAARYYLYVLRYDYKNADYIYKLARCYGFMNEYELASKYLIRAINAGYNDLENIESDKAFAGIKRTQIFKETIKEIDKYNDKLGSVVYIKGCKLNKCRIKLPYNYNSENEYSLVIGLHGNGGSSDSFIRTGDYFAKKNFIFAAPQGAYIRSQSNGKLNAQYSWEIQIPDVNLWKRSDPLSEEYIMNVVNYFKANYNIKNVYLSGFSQGAAYTYLTGIKYSELFKGIIALGGVLLSLDEDYSVMTEEQLHKGKDLKVFIGHGTQDKVINIEQGRSAKRKLNKAGYNVTFFTYNSGHTLTKELFEEILKWLEDTENE